MNITPIVHTNPFNAVNFFSLDEICKELRQEVYFKKYPFSDESLNCAAINLGIRSGEINGIKVSRKILIDLLKYHANLGDENVQELLYSILNETRENTSPTESSEACELLQLCFKQEKMWAIKAKINDFIKAKKGKSFSIVECYIMAAHQGDENSIRTLANLLGDKVIISMTLGMNITTIKKEFSISKYFDTGFGATKWQGKRKPWTHYGCPLNTLGEYFLHDYVVNRRGASLQTAMEYFAKAADLGDGAAMFHLGKCHKVKKNYKVALEFFEKAAAKGQKEALFKICRLTDNINKLRWLALAADKGYIDAMFYAGIFESKEFSGHMPNFSKALSYYYCAADLGDARAMHNAAMIENEGFVGHKADSKKAITLWKKAAALGCTEAMFPLALFEEKSYEDGTIDTLERALSWYVKAALAGDEEGMYNAALVEAEEYSGHAPNPSEVLRWSTLAASKGHLQAMTVAGNVEQQDFNGHKPNLNKALYWHTKAAERGDVTSMFEAGALEYKSFEGHKQNMKKVLSWYDLASERGEIQAMNNLGSLELKGFKGRPSNPEKAFQLFVKSAGKGNWQAMVNAGTMERLGFKDHPSNLNKALEWYLQAAETGYTPAMCRVAMIYIRLDSNAYLTDALFWLRRAQKEGDLSATKLIEMILSNSKDNDDEVLQIVNLEKDEPEASLTYAETELPQKKLMSSATLDEDLKSVIKDEDDWEDVLAFELAGYPDFYQSPEKIDEIINIRNKCDHAKELDEQFGKFKISLENLSSNNKFTWEKLNNPMHPVITLAELIHFAEDKAFGGKFFHGPTSSGIMFAFANDIDGETRYGTVSTHGKHNKSYKGTDKNFAKDFRDLVCKVLNL